MSKQLAGQQLKKDQLKGNTGGKKQHNSSREFVESVVIAIMLAFLFRAFEAEAFVIPTGSMAPTLMGEHKDLTCSQCGQPYQTSASSGDITTNTQCPTCRFPMQLDPVAKPNQGNFSGDRILVSKFAYELGDPERWDVIVFKYPGNAKQNYIKRLIGLPGETVRVRHGDIYIQSPGDQQFQIAQRSPEKTLAMLQLVHDNDHQSPLLHKIGWPNRWHNGTSARVADTSRWQPSEDNRTYRVDGQEGPPATLHYRHTVPSADDWYAIENGQTPPGINDTRGELITDFCAYNAFRQNYNDDVHWVGDIAMECTLQVLAGDGTFTTEIVEAGAHYQCHFDLASGKATLTRDDDQAVFLADNKAVASLEADSPITGPGTYELQMANLNDSICLWVDGNPINFGEAGKVVRYTPPAENRPHWSPERPGDLAPARLTAEGLQAEVSSLKILRDIYYVAIDRNLNARDDYNFPESAIRSVLHDPTAWDQTQLFDSRRTVEFEIAPGEFFPMGDNSPASLDGRLWDTPPAASHAVPRKLMIGKALVVYWPHTWNRPVPFTPNPQKMRLIK